MFSRIYELLTILQYLGLVEAHDFFLNLFGIRTALEPPEKKPKLIISSFKLIITIN